MISENLLIQFRHKLLLVVANQNKEEKKTNNQKQLEKITAEIDSIKEAVKKVTAKGELKPL
jgi:hypothetical protein